MNGLAEWKEYIEGGQGKGTLLKEVMSMLVRLGVSNSSGTAGQMRDTGPVCGPELAHNLAPYAGSSMQMHPVALHTESGTWGWSIGSVQTSPGSSVLGWIFAGAGIICKCVPWTTLGVLQIPALTRTSPTCQSGAHAACGTHIRPAMCPGSSTHSWSVGLILAGPRSIVYGAGLVQVPHIVLALDWPYMLCAACARWAPPTTCSVRSWASGCYMPWSKTYR